MESNIGNINKIPILDVLNKLGYSEGTDYIVKGNNIRMIQGGKVTDGWIGDISDNRLYARSGLKSGRFEGDIVGIVKGALNIDVASAILWCEDNFGLMKNKVEKETNLNDIFKGKSELSKENIEYLNSRGIDYNKLSSSIIRGDNGISIPIKSENGSIIGIQTRALTGEKKFRYRIEGVGKGLFMDNLELPSIKKTLFIVEGATDFLTLRQFTTNVIGLVSAETGIEMLKAFHNSYDLIFIRDNDDAGESSLKKFQDEKIRFGTYKIDDEYNDVNDFWNGAKLLGVDGIGFLTEIYNGADKIKGNLEIAFDKANDIFKIGVMSYGDRTLDILLGGLMRGSNVLINGPSGQGKTTLSLHMMRCLLKEHKGKKICYYSLETNVGRQLMQIIAFMSGTNEEEVFKNLSKYKPYLKQLDGLEVYDNIRSVEGIQKHITENNVDIAFIDFAQKARISGISDETGKMIAYAQRMQDFAIDNGNVAIISLSQTSMGNYKVPILDRVPKSSGALFESSDSTINVGRDENGKWVVGFMKTKNIGAKGWYTICETNYNPTTGEYQIFLPIGKEIKSGKKIGL